MLWVITRPSFGSPAGRSSKLTLTLNSASCWRAVLSDEPTTFGTSMPGAPVETISWTSLPMSTSSPARAGADDQPGRHGVALLGDTDTRKVNGALSSS